MHIHLEAYQNRQIDPGEWLTTPPSGKFSYANNAYFITFSKLSRWDADLGWQYFELPIDIGYGINFKMIDIGLADKTASGIGIDGGFLISMGLNNLFNDEMYGRLSLGMSVQDIFETQIAWDTDTKHKDKIERNWKYGFSYSQPLHFMDSIVLFAYDINSKYEGSTHLGIDFVYKSLVALRLGSNDGAFTAGAGLAYWKIQIDYAYQNHDLGNSHRVGFSFGL